MVKRYLEGVKRWSDVQETELRSGVGQLPEAGRGRGPVSLLQPPERSSPDTYSVFGPLELPENKCIVFEVIRSMVIWSRSYRK